MNYPEFLPENGTVAFAAPSFGAAIEPYKSLLDNAVRRIRERGYGVDLGPNAYLGEGFGISNTPEKCARELEDYYLHHGDVLISVGGGELMCETVGKLDTGLFEKAKPKWFMGYSDNTNFGFLLPTIWDTASFYGPNSSDFGMGTLHESIEDAWNLLTGKCRISHGYDLWECEPFKCPDEPLASYHLTEPTKVKAFGWNGETTEGRFLGGCLDVLENLCGTRLDHVKEFEEKYRQDGIIWFLEACELSPMSIRRTLWHLKNAGWFDTAKAFVFGRPLCLVGEKESFGMDEYGAVNEALKELHVPVLCDADIGHLSPMMTMMNGGYGILSPYGKNNIQIEWTFK